MHIFSSLKVGLYYKVKFCETIPKGNFNLQYSNQSMPVAYNVRIKMIEFELQN